MLNAASILDLRGDDNDRSMKQVKVLRDLARQGANQLPQDFDVSITDRVWHDLLKVPDRGKALAALRACAAASCIRC